MLIIVCLIDINVNLWYIVIVDLIILFAVLGVIFAQGRLPFFLDKRLVLGYIGCVVIDFFICTFLPFRSMLRHGRIFMFRFIRFPASLVYPLDQLAQGRVFFLSQFDHLLHLLSFLSLVSAL